MMIGTLDSTEWFDISFKPWTVAVVQGTETDRGKERGVCFWKRPLVDMLGLGMRGAIP